MLDRSILPNILLSAALVAVVSPRAAAGSGAIRGQIEPFLEEHCFDCHDDELSEGDLNLYDLDFEPDKLGNFRLWERVFDRVESGESVEDVEVESNP